MSRERSPSLAAAGAKGRVLGLLLLLPVLAIAALSWRTLFADLQIAITDAKLTGIAWRVDTLETVRYAATLTPWRAAPHVAAARTLTTIRELDAALDETAIAAGLDPSSSFHYLYWARLRGSSDRYDLPLLQAYEQAIALAPNDDHVRWTVATDGVMRWRHGDSDLRALWTRSIDFNLERRQRNALLRVVVYNDKEASFCAALGNRPTLAEWCTWIKPARKNCLAENLPPKGEQWCLTSGFPTLKALPP